MIFSGGVEISHSSQVSIEHGELRFNSISAQDKGEFACEASNILGTIRKTVAMSLTGKIMNRIMDIDSRESERSMSEYALDSRRVMNALNMDEKTLEREFSMSPETKGPLHEKLQASKRMVRVRLETHRSGF